MDKPKLNNEKGSSFVESLITIVVAGMACVAFISVTAAIVKETKDREVKELMTGYALNGLDRVRAINGRNEGYTDSEGEEHSFADLTWNVEYSFAIEEDELSLVSSVTDYDCVDSSDCEEIDYEDRDDFFYRKVSMEKAKNENDKVVRVTVEVGKKNPTGDVNLDKYSVEGFVATL